MENEQFASVQALILDDNAFARSVGRRILTTAGVGTIYEAANGRRAIDLLQEATPPIDIVFCDLVMPDMDGVQFLRHVAVVPSKPVLVFVSGAGAPLLATAESTARARNLSVLGSIQKPFTLDGAVRALEALENAVAAAPGGGRRAVTFSTAELMTALREDQLLLYFQPKSALADGQLVGFESLCRWRHPTHGMIPPGAFIPAAERAGLIGALTDRTMMLALEQCAAWSASGLRKKLSVNLSAHMLVDVELPERLAAEAARFAIDPAQLILEITESGVFKDVANTLEILARLHMKGFCLSIDDFGTGYSSLEQLSRVPFTEMKIDRAFVHGTIKNPRALAILESSANLGRMLGMSVVAEGAETQEDWDLLHRLGVDVVQGYFVARPMAAEQVPAWCAEWEAR